MSTDGNTPITNDADVIDSRDVIARIDFLEGCEVLDDDETTELAALRALAEQGEDYIPDWRYGETLVHADYFETYARELAEDVGAVDPNASWPLTYIDWKRAAAALLEDYQELDFAGQTYYAR